MNGWAFTFGPGHPRLDQRVVRGQLVAEGAVALFQPAGGAVHADADRHQPVRGARRPERVPQLRRPARSARAVPSRAHPRRRCARPARTARRSPTSRQVPNGKPAVAHVVAGDRRPAPRGPRPPQPERGLGGGQVGERGGAVGGQVVGEPVQVGHAGGAAGHHPEPFRAQPHDGQVGLEPAALVQQRGVDDPARAPRRAARRPATAPTSSAAGPVTSKIANADRSTSPHASRMARCSALMIGDHQRASHSASRGISRPA